ncbi:MAG TPA: malto-oligosyltrehalose synthase [Xanthobacteraceae bacterium]|nr:malto-oligosyltrehalose synthase [Xanthobacteraceae bacterium]
MSRPTLRATYRLQFHRGFPFAAAQALVPYFAELGVSHLYASPVFAAVPGSTHGYDVTDPTRFNPELGGEAGFRALAEALRAHGLGLILDIVPNHMAAATGNPYWSEVLELGRNAPAARLFDIDWDAGPLRLPVLGETLQDTLGAGELTVRADWEQGRIGVDYAGQLYPLAPQSLAAPLAAALGSDSPLAGAWARLAAEEAGSQALAQARAQLRAATPEQRERIGRLLSGLDLASLLEAQHWRLAWWRTAADDLNYRRFFNIAALVGVRAEAPEAFELVHRLPLALLAEGLIDGLRIDHIDGLAEPAAYLQRLRAAVGPEVPLFVEKILGLDEALPGWPVNGTTGYERLNDINGLFVDPAGFEMLAAHLAARNLIAGAPAERLASAKGDVLATSFGTEIDRLARLALDGEAEELRAADITEAALRRGLAAVVAHFPVYRSYADASSHSAADAGVWQATRAAIEANEDPLTARAAGVLLDRLAEPQGPAQIELRSRLQQLTGPAMAKGYEDTELYRNVALGSVNEVGSDLAAPARTRADMHARAGKPGGLVPLATHDTKRGPGVRARLNALALAPEAWLAFVSAADEMTAALRRSEHGRTMPDDLDAWLIYQTLFAAWPIDRPRLDAYLTKALREAKRHTNWETPDPAYEDAVLGFAGALADGEAGAPFRALLAERLALSAPAARLFGLAQTVLQLTLPGTPDLYQGTEFRDFSLVDPDNRRPVDWDARRAVLAGDTRGADPDDVALFALTRRLLHARRDLACLTQGGYQPLTLDDSPWRWFGFRRTAPADALLVVVPTRWSEAEPALAFASDIGTGWQTLAGDEVPGGGRMMLDPAQPFALLLRRGR